MVNCLTDKTLYPCKHNWIEQVIISKRNTSLKVSSIVDAKLKYFEILKLTYVHYVFNIFKQTS